MIRSRWPVKREQEKQNRGLKVRRQHRALEVQQKGACARKRKGEKPQETVVLNYQFTPQELIQQNTTMLSKISNYQNELELRNRKIEILEKQVNDVKKYNHVATLDITGRAIPNGDIVFTSDLTILMDQILEHIDNVYRVKTDSKVLIIIDEAIKKFPNFPFGYYTKAVFFKNINNQNWKDPAEKAFSIFEITTTINGHNKNHDEAMKVLTTWLKK